MRIASVASAFPEHYHKQEVLVGALKNYWIGQLANPGILDRLDESMKVDGRYTVRPLSYYHTGMETWGEANNVWIEAALDLGETSLCRALARAGHRAGQIERNFCHIGDGHRRAFD